MIYVKSKERVAAHGEVFTPKWLVNAMLEQVSFEAERIDSRFLEPACGSGNFLIPVLQRKFTTVTTKYGRSEFEKKHNALLALMSIYGIEILEDNVLECRAKLHQVFIDYIQVDSNDVWSKAAKIVLDSNIVHGDALKMKTYTMKPIVFPEWAYVGKGKYQRRDFLYENLTHRSSIQDTLFQALDEADLFTPIYEYPRMTASQIAELERQA